MERRWNVKNKGFNNLKNYGYIIKHAYSYKENTIAVQLIEQNE